MTETIRALNYSTHAIEDVRQLAKLAYPTEPRSAARMRLLANILGGSEKFLLPNRCELLDPDSIGQAHLDLLRLPYPCVALEAPWEGTFEPKYGGAEQEPATRRIALCWQVDPGLPAFFDEAGDPLDLAGTKGVCVLPIYKVAGARSWTVACAGVFISTDARAIPLSEAPSMGAGEIQVTAHRQAGLVTRKSAAIELCPFVFLPERYGSLVSQLGEERTQAALLGDANDEVLMVIQTCAVLNCENVETGQLPAPKALNKRRLAKGHAPLFSYKILTVSEKRSSRSKGEPEGTHASPRSHLRRGHLRRVSDRNVWVRPAIVGGNGAIHKDYRLVEDVSQVRTCP